MSWFLLCYQTTFPAAEFVEFWHSGSAKLVRNIQYLCLLVNSYAAMIQVCQTHIPIIHKAAFRPFYLLFVCASYNICSCVLLITYLMFYLYAFSSFHPEKLLYIINSLQHCTGSLSISAKISFQN